MHTKANWVVYNKLNKTKESDREKASSFSYFDLWIFFFTKSWKASEITQKEGEKERTILGN